MAKKEKLGSIKRFGARYGRKPKAKFAIIEKEQRRLHKCPYCNKVKVKRVAMGIWECRACKEKFTGKAYSLNKKVLEDEAEEQLPEEKQEETLEEEVEETEQKEGA